MSVEYITYKQGDSRWGSKNYNGSSTYAAAACGPTSCAGLLYGLDHTITPVTCGDFMKKNGYAIYGNGTAHAGIPACLKHFGAKNVKECSTMSEAWEYTSKGYVGIILFRGGTKGGITWTTCGHFIDFTDYKEKDGKHYLYMRDCGGRDHVGWYAYETTMKGLVCKIWVCQIEEPEPQNYTGKYPTAECSIESGTTTNIKRWQTFLCWWGENVDIDGKFGKDTKAKTITFQKAYDIGKHTGTCGTKTIAKAKEIGQSEKH